MTRRPLRCLIGVHGPWKADGFLARWRCLIGVHGPWKADGQYVLTIRGKGKEYTADAEQCQHCPFTRYTVKGIPVAAHDILQARPATRPR